MNFFLAALRRDLLLTFRRRNDIINPLAFFLMVGILFPLGVSPEASFLSQLAPGVIWVAALLASLLSVDGIFRSDFDDGSLEHMLVSPQPLLLLVLAKVTNHWLISGFCLALVSPILALMLFLPSEGVKPLILSLLLGTPTLSLIGAIWCSSHCWLKERGDSNLFIGTTTVYPCSYFWSK